MPSRGMPPAAGQASILSFFRPNADGNSDGSHSNSRSPRDQQPTSQPQPPPPPPTPPPPAPSAAPKPSPSLGTLPPAPLTPTPTPHPCASIAPIAPEHIAALRRINALLLCVNYPDSFYQRALDPAASGLLSRAILWTDGRARPAQVVGSLVARVERPSPLGRGRAAVYVQSLTLLAPYRSLGLARAALDAVLDHARALPDVDHVYAHVWTENEDGLRWYRARGFERVGAQPVAGYYVKLRPDTAWIVRRPLGPPAAPTAMAAAAATAGGPPQVVPPSITAAVVNLPTPPPPPSQANNASAKAAALCFQDKRPESDWNDLPPDVAAGLLTPGSGASSRSSSTARTAKKKKDRSYPAGAFGG